jgi:hypothetical protein
MRIEPRPGAALAAAELEGLAAIRARLRERRQMHGARAEIQAGLG